MQIAIFGADNATKRLVETALRTGAEGDASRGETAIYLPVMRPAGPDLEDAARALKECAARNVRHVVAVSSAEVYGATPNNPGLIVESRPARKDGKNAIAAAWFAYESLLESELAGKDIALTLLRPSTVLGPDGDGYVGRLLSGPIALTLAGHDPSIQLLAPADLASAVASAAYRSSGGIFNVAPDSVIPLKAALDATHAKRLSLPRGVHVAARHLLSSPALDVPIDQLDYIRYSWTVSNEKIKRELKFSPSRSSAQTLVEFLGGNGASSLLERRFDDFGMDKAYIAKAAKVFVDFLCRRYWRVDVEGLEHVPDQGRGILAGIHRGLVAWDGVMLLHILNHRARLSITLKS